MSRFGLALLACSVVAVRTLAQTPFIVADLVTSPLAASSATPRAFVQHDGAFYCALTRSHGRSALMRTAGPQAPLAEVAVLQEGLGIVDIRPGGGGLLLVIAPGNAQPHRLVRFDLNTRALHDLGAAGGSNSANYRLANMVTWFFTPCQ